MNMSLEQVRDALLELAESFDKAFPGRASNARRWADAIDAHLNAAKGEAVAWQYREVTEDGPSPVWDEASRMHFEILRNDRRYEVRELYTHPGSPDVMRDAERYRWLRKHSAFANDSMHELWFDASLDRGETEQLDKQIDDAMAAREGGE